MSASPQDVQAQIDAAVKELKLTTQGYVKGSTGKHWVAGLSYLVAARDEAGQLVGPLAAAFDFKEN